MQTLVKECARSLVGSRVQGRLSSAELSQGRDRARVVLLCWVAGDGRGRGDDAADLKGRGGRILHTHPCIPAAH